MSAMTKKESFDMRLPSSSDTEIPERTTSSDEEKQESAKQVSGTEFLVQWDGDNDPLNPRSLSPSRKWFIVFVVSMGSLLV
jgi:hypothetical protein